MFNKYFTLKNLVIFQVIVIIFMIGLYIARPDIKYIVIEESSLGFLPRNILSKKYDLEEELKSFVQVYLFKRYNFTPENASFQIEDSFKLSSKRVQDAIEKNIASNDLYNQVKKEKLSQIYTPKNIEYGREKDLIEVKTQGERIITKNNNIDSRDNIKLSFLIRLKERDSLNPYRFYIDGIKEEVSK